MATLRVGDEVTALGHTGVLVKKDKRTDVLPRQPNGDPSVVTVAVIEVAKDVTFECDLALVEGART